MSAFNAQNSTNFTFDDCTEQEVEVEEVFILKSLTLRCS